MQVRRLTDRDQGVSRLHLELEAKAGSGTLQKAQLAWRLSHLLHSLQPAIQSGPQQRCNSFSMDYGSSLILLREGSLMAFLRLPPCGLASR